MLPQVYQPPDLKRLLLTPAGKDFALYTDGSGHADGFGGHAVLCVSEKYHKFFVRSAGVYGTTTERQEFEALLSGLQGIMDVMDWNNHAAHDMLQHMKASVFWLSDREALVGCVRRENGKPLFRRRTCLDLWARFDFYEHYFDIEAVHRNRNDNPYQALTDQVSSESRDLMKDYITILQTDKVL
jgi:ribonuclease HI